MKDDELQFDHSCHVLYSKTCKKEIQSKIALHYPEAEREMIWEKVQRQYVDFLSDWRKDLGGKRNFHNGAGGTYDCIAIMSYYAVCKPVTSFREIEEIEENLILPSFRKLKFVNCNKPFWKKLMHMAFLRAKAGCDKWHDYEMTVAPYEKNKPIYYEFTACPAAEFAIRNGLTEIMPALCNVDFAAMELLHARLVRTTTCANGCKCDYAICGDQDPYGRERSRIPGRKRIQEEQGMLLQVILEGLGLGVLLVLICAAGIRKGAVGMVHLYSPAVQQRCVKLGLTSPERIRRNSLLFKAVCVPGYISYVLVCVYGINGARSFAAGFWQLLVILSVMNLIDRFLIDGYWVGHTNAWTIPGTEDLKPYITAKNKQKRWLFGTVGMAVIAMVLAAMMTIFTH